MLSSSKTLNYDVFLLHYDEVAARKFRFNNNFQFICALSFNQIIEAKFCTTDVVCFFNYKLTILNYS